jgi:hypothetical protein
LGRFRLCCTPFVQSKCLIDTTYVITILLSHTHTCTCRPGKCKNYGSRILRPDESVGEGNVAKATACKLRGPTCARSNASTKENATGSCPAHSKSSRKRDKLPLALAEPPYKRPRRCDACRTEVQELWAGVKGLRSQREKFAVPSEDRLEHTDEPGESSVQPLSCVFLPSTCAFIPMWTTLTVTIASLLMSSKYDSKVGEQAPAAQDLHGKVVICARGPTASNTV